MVLSIDHSVRLGSSESPPFTVVEIARTDTGVLSSGVEVLPDCVTEVPVVPRREGRT